MLITRTVTKKILESIVHETFSNFGNLSSSSLLDSLKLLGFYYATNAGISINIEDLKTPDVKKSFIKTANNEIDEVSRQWQQGFVSDTERFQSIIDSWNIATESLKNRIVDYYQIFDPANNLYIMAFSGARGNMSQVRQLVGMRGLMSDQEGKIIDLPIQANFREGLSSIDYIISSYGARKGIVDTALKTADSGYLTRRLIYLAQDLVIREIDCQTETGILVLLNKKTNIKNIIGRNLLNARMLKYPYTKVYEGDQTLTEETLKLLKRNSPLILNVRSSLTCQSTGSICQKCYGWDLAQEKLISLGEAVGIIAAQSIGEPGTQLTMRTFHTGGIFTSETLKQVVAPFSGKIIIPKSLKTISYRTNHGIVVLKLQQETNLTIVNWKGVQKDVFLDIGSYLYINDSSFVKKGQLIAEYSTQAAVPGTRRLKPIYTSLAGEIRFENLLVRKMLRDKRTVKVNQDDGVLWIASGKIFPLPREVKYLFPPILDRKKAFATLKIVTPYDGIAYVKDEFLIIKNQERKISLDLLHLTKSIKNCSIKFIPLVQTYQYVDKYTTLCVVEIFPNEEGLIYSVRKKESSFISTLFIVTESDIWKINSDQTNDFSFFQEKKAIVRAGNSINTTSKFSRSGFFLKKDGFKMIFQNAMPIFLSRGTILNYKQGDFVLEKEILATLVNYTQQTEDIVQGLPKIEELVEARRPKTKAYLSVRPGVVLNFFSSGENLGENLDTYLTSSVINCIYKGPKENELPLSTNVTLSKKKQEKQTISIGHSIYLKDEIIIHNNKIYKAIPIPSIFQPVRKNEKSNEFLFKNVKEIDEQYPLEDLDAINDDEILLVDNKAKFSIWKPEKVNLNSQNNVLYKYKNKNLVKWLTIKDIGIQTIFSNIKEDYIIFTEELNYIFLDRLNPIQEYEIPLTSKLLFEPGSFVDIGEPITEGMVDVHELLDILFQYHSILDGIMFGTIRTLSKFQLLLVNSVQSIYQSQGVSISSKHIEIIVRQMTAKVVIKESGDTPLLPGEIFRLSQLNEIYEAIKLDSSVMYKTPQYEPFLVSATTASLLKDGFLSAAGFQETKRVLTRAAIEGSSDWLRGLKECIIIGRLIPAGSAFLNYKSYLDNVYLFKN
jgi:hypothetical protein